MYGTYSMSDFPVLGKACLVWCLFILVFFSYSIVVIIAVYHTIALRLI